MQTIRQLLLGKPAFNAETAHRISEGFRHGDSAPFSY